MSPERRDGARLLVDKDFTLRGFRRVDRVFGDSVGCHFLRETDTKIGRRAICHEVYIEQHPGSRVRWGLGIEVPGTDWWDLPEFGRPDSVDDCLPLLQKVTAFYGPSTFFPKKIEAMQREYQRGKAFVAELIPKFLSRFSRYSLVYDQFALLKDVVFVEPGLQEAVVWGIDSGEFRVSVGEVIPGRKNWNNPFRVKGKDYFVTNRVAVWYPTEERETSYSEGDFVRRSELLKQSLETLGAFLERKSH